MDAAQRGRLRPVRDGDEEAGQTAGKGLIRQQAEAASVRASRWWAVRSAGGTFRVLRRWPEAMNRLGVASLSDLARPFCARAGLRLSTWAPVRVFQDGARRLLTIPAERGLKYVGLQALQAGVGVVAFGKMEEHLESRRPPAETFWRGVMLPTIVADEAIKIPDVSETVAVEALPSPQLVALGVYR